LNHRARDTPINLWLNDLDRLFGGEHHMLIHGHEVKGNDVDNETRCLHYHSEIDRIAIKFYCCDSYYPCFSCHEEAGCTTPKVWPVDQFDQKAILCGACGHEL